MPRDGAIQTHITAKELKEAIQPCGANATLAQQSLGSPDGCCNFIHCCAAVL